MIPVIYRELCPQCKGDLSWDEIENNFCKKTGKRLNLTHEEEIYSEFEEFFENIFKSKPRAIQRMWARRILSGDSFAAIAPTGIGKTSFGIVMSIFLSTKGKRSYLLFPTTIVLKEVVKKLQDLGCRDLAFYYTGLKEKDKILERVENGEFKVLVTTTAFLSKNFALVKNKSFDFIFVDDIDALLKRSRNLNKILEILNKNGVLMVSTATGTKGYNTRILREKLGFDVGNMRNAVRNIEDIFSSKDLLMDILNRMGPGALIFAPTQEEAKEVAEIIGDRAGVVIEEDKKAYEKFSEGELDYLVGVSTPYGSLIRGIDMPKRIRYVIFYGIPRFKLNTENIDKLSDKFLMTLSYILKDKVLDELLNKRDIEGIRNRIKEILKTNKEIKGESFIYRDGYIIFPDINTYIQGSGRSSRLYAGGITKGASFLLDSSEMVEIFMNRAYVYGIEFKALDEVNIDGLKREIDEDRKRIGERVEEKDIITPALLIVESPNKAKHISHFFGKPNIRIIGNAVVYEVAIGERVLTIAPSLGHTVDLVTTDGFHGVLKDGFFIPVYSPIRKCHDCGYQFTEGDRCPICGSRNIYNAGKQIEVLRKLAYECEEIIVGTDPDTEGEKIAFDLMNLLRPFGRIIKRAEYHEVTREAILRALRESRDFNLNLVKAQMVRRIEDRWIGFELSQILWNKFGNRNLSAGRAQTPVLGWIIERYGKSKESRVEYYIKDTDIKVPWQGYVNANVTITGEETREYLVPPYTTDEILKDSNTILHIGSEETMGILQNLFESGLITYHRTDSTHVSKEGMNIAKKYLGENFRPNQWGEEGAHECIRPTRPWTRDDVERLVKEGVLSINIERKAFLVYDLIFRRFMASQSKGEIKIINYEISANGEKINASLTVEARGKSYELYPYRVKVYRPLQTGFVKIEVEKRLARIYPYSQADVIRAMKEKGIGRPSTYATIISRLFKRNYVIERNGKLIPTKIGYAVHSFLTKNYSSFVSEERTKILEKKMEDVEQGNADYQGILKELYEEMSNISRA